MTNEDDEQIEVVSLEDLAEIENATQDDELPGQVPPDDPPTPPDDSPLPDPPPPPDDDE